MDFGSASVRGGLGGIGRGGSGGHPPRPCHLSDLTCAGRLGVLPGASWFPFVQPVLNHGTPVPARWANC